MTITDNDVARSLYESDVAARPNYPDGSPRKSWDDLPGYARWSWSPARFQKGQGENAPHA